MIIFSLSDVFLKKLVDTMLVNFLKEFKPFIKLALLIEI